MQARDLPPEAGWFLAGVLAGQEQDAAAAPGLLCHAGGHRAPQLSGREEVAEEERLDQLGLQLPKKPKSDIGAIVPGCGSQGLGIFVRRFGFSGGSHLFCVCALC